MYYVKFIIQKNVLYVKWDLHILKNYCLSCRVMWVRNVVLVLRERTINCFAILGGSHHTDISNKQKRRFVEPSGFEPMVALYDCVTRLWSWRERTINCFAILGGSHHTDISNKQKRRFVEPSFFVCWCTFRDSNPGPTD